MNANEFQIGDWVQWNFDVEPKHRQIFSIITEEDSDGNKEYYVDLGDGEIYKDLIPIPLTPELLEKNGFNISISKGEWSPNVGGFEFDNSYTDELRWNSIKINYVHELQHALRLCGLNDLADNFKI